MSASFQHADSHPGTGAAELEQRLQAALGERDQLVLQQTATAEMLKVIAGSPDDVQPVFEAIVQTAARLLRCDFSGVLLYDGSTISLVTTATREGLGTDLRPTNFPIDPATNFPSRAILAKENLYLPDWSKIELPEHERQVQARYGMNSGLYLPLLRDGECIGLLFVGGTRPDIFGPAEIALAESFRDQALIAIENTRRFNETREALERQTATADILKVIASSPDDVQPVFQAIAERSNRLVDGRSTAVYRIVGNMQHLMAFTPVSPAADAALKAYFPAPLSTLSNAHEAILKGEIFVYVDSELELASEPARLAVARQRGWRSALFVPLLRDQKPIGLITVTRADPGTFARHHVQLLQTFADQAVIAIANVELFRQVQERTRELSASLDDLRAAQDRLVQTEKLASLGQLTAGIAHEIKNPLNFVNNFSALSTDLVDELHDALRPAALTADTRGVVDELTALLKGNLEKIVQHGQRANSIVKNMLLHSREGSGEQRATDINALVEESLNLAYHGARAERPGFDITLQRDLDPSAGMAELYPQEITRVLLNLIANGFYATLQRKASAGDSFEPLLSAATKCVGNQVEIRIRDNGTGIPAEVQAKMFNPFFTTKPAGQGTGLGLSMSHDIVVKQHGGKIDVITESGIFTEFVITLPRTAAASVQAGGAP